METDWLGQEYGVGDYVLYSRSSGYAAQMFLAKVIRINEHNVIAEPVKSSRFSTGGVTRYYDSRTRKNIERTADKHIERDSGYIQQNTGKYFSFSEKRAWDKEHKLNYWEDGDFKYTYTIYKDYVTQGPTYTVLQIKENITKWTGAMPNENNKEEPA